jgi:hypothetical protein
MFMPLQPPSAQTGVPRGDVGEVVESMLVDQRVRWIAIVVQDSMAGEDRFEVTPWVIDPTAPSTNRT